MSKIIMDAVPEYFDENGKLNESLYNEIKNNNKKNKNNNTVEILEESNENDKNDSDKLIDIKQ